jgi:periplasmic protein TonB
MMFADSLLENHWTNHGRRGWTTLASFALQTFAIAILLMLPLIYTKGIPKLHLVSMSAPIGPPLGPPPVAQQHPAMRPGQSNIFHGIIVTPGTIPSFVRRMVDDTVPQDAAPCSICVPGGVGNTNANAIPGGLGNAVPMVPPPPPRPAAPPPRVSHMMEGNLIYKIQPVYPPLARQARIQGSVLLRAIISRTGTIENLNVISGHPMLVGAAIEAVRQWRYRPYILNDEPVEVETQVTVNFSLSGG